MFSRHLIHGTRNEPMIFLSYAAEDRAMVNRVYDNLVRAGGRSWRYDFHSQLGSDCITEYKTKVSDSDALVLIDTPHSRSSEHVGKEIEEARRSIGNQDSRLQKILVCNCASEPNEEWRQNEPFIGLNNIVYCDLTFPDELDQHDKFLKEMDRMCLELGLDLINSNRVSPLEEDLAAELKHLDHPRLRGTVIEGYRSFKLFERKHFELALEHIMVTKNTLLQFGYQTISIELAAAGLFGFHGHFNDAIELLLSIKKDFPEDPRTYALLGDLCLDKRDFTNAIHYYENALQLIDQTDNVKHHGARNAVFFNYIQGLLHSNSIEAAERELAAHNSLEQAILPEFRIAEINLHLAKGAVGKAKEQLNQLDHVLDKPWLNDKGLNVILAEMYWNWAQKLANQHGEQNEVSTVAILNAVRRAHEIQPSQPFYIAELAETITKSISAFGNFMVFSDGSYEVLGG